MLSNTELAQGFTQPEGQKDKDLEQTRRRLIFPKVSHTLSTRANIPTSWLPKKAQDKNAKKGTFAHTTQKLYRQPAWLSGWLSTDL